jgi:hypothetical protein
MPDASPPRKAVVYNILWKMGLWGCWYYDDSAYPEEQEVLLFDGCAFEVLGVSTDTYSGKEVTVISLKV